MRQYLESSGLRPLLHDALEALTSSSAAARLALAAGAGLEGGAAGYRPRDWRPFDDLQLLGSCLMQQAGARAAASDAAVGAAGAPAGGGGEPGAAAASAGGC